MVQKNLVKGSNYKLRTDDIIRNVMQKGHKKQGDKLSDMEIVALLRDLMDKRNTHDLSPWEADYDLINQDGIRENV